MLENTVTPRIEESLTWNGCWITTGLLIAITLFMIYAKLDEVQTALKENTQAVVNVEQEISFLSVEQQAFRDLRHFADRAW